MIVKIERSVYRFYSGVVMTRFPILYIYITVFNVSERFKELKSSNETYYHTVIVDSSTDQIVGSATLIKERKFIHKCANVS